MVAARIAAEYWQTSNPVDCQHAKKEREVRHATDSITDSVDPNHQQSL